MSDTNTSIIKKRKGIKDPVSGILHLIGMLLSIAGLVLLIIDAARYGEGAWDVVTFTIFGSALVLLYLFSSLYHLLNLGETGTKVFKKFDHMMIYVLIAATYTPICLGPLRGPWGWLVVIMAYPFIMKFKELNALSSILWLLAGGIFYTIGGLIYGLKKFPFTTKHFGFHEIFHIFVMLGSFCQFWFIFKHLLYI